jgi:MFS family permease
MAITSIRRSLWKHSDFLKLWTAQTTSQFGQQFTGLALPLTAVLFLNATPFQMGILEVTWTLPFLLFGLVVGVWVDRHKRRGVMVIADIFRGFLLAIIPVSFLLHVLSLPLVFAISFLVGILTVFFDVSYQAYLPSLVSREELVEGNSKLEASRSVAQVVGPSIAGVAIQLVQAPLAIAVDSVTFLGSAFSLGRIRHDEQISLPDETESVLSDIREGLAVVLNDHRLRPIAFCSGMFNFFYTAVFALTPLYLVGPDYLGFSALTLGLIFTVGSIGAIMGVLFSARSVQRFGVGPVIVGSIFLAGVGLFPIYLATRSLGFSVLNIGGFSLDFNFLMIIGGQFLSGAALVAYNINQVSLRQTLLPSRIQGRMNATMRFLVWGTIPLGGVAGGIIGTALGLREALLIGAIGSSLAFMWVLFSPIRSLKSVPEPIA